MGHWVPFLLPFVPMVTRGWLAPAHHRILSKPVPHGWLSADANRVVIIAIAGFGFTGVVGITVLESATRRQELQLPIFYLLVSFLCSLVALNLESYRFFISRLIIGGVLYDIATFSLIASIVAVVVLAHYPVIFTVLVTVVAVCAWVPDHYLGLRYSQKVLNDFETETEEAQTAKKLEPKPFC